MKKSKIYTLVMLAFMTFGFALTVRAQFSDSEEVYCYQYVKTVDENGVISKKANSRGVLVDSEVFFVNFQNNMMGLCYDRISEARKKIVSDPNFYNNKALNSITENKKSTHDYRYNASLSTDSKITYSAYDHYTDWINNPGRRYDGWADLHYSFSRDRSELIIWKSSGLRVYYKLIDPNSLKPNLDFLD